MEAPTLDGSGYGCRYLKHGCWPALAIAGASLSPVHLDGAARDMPGAGQKQV